jgi:hypothetical protein
VFAVIRAPAGGAEALVLRRQPMHTFQKADYYVVPLAGLAGPPKDLGPAAAGPPIRAVDEKDVKQAEAAAFARCVASARERCVALHIVTLALCALCRGLPSLLAARNNACPYAEWAYLRRRSTYLTSSTGRECRLSPRGPNARRSLQEQVDCRNRPPTLS